LSPAEEKSLLDWCSRPREHLRLVVLGLLDTGMREGEPKTRRRRDLDFDAREIRIFARPVASTDWATKTEEGRIVPMSDRLYAELIARGVDQLPENAIAFGYTSSVKTAWRTAKRLAGVVNLQLRDLRHTAATRMIAGGMELAEVARILGHADVRTSYRYVNLHAGTVAKALEAMNLVNKRNWGSENAGLN
jgi:integrase